MAGVSNSQLLELLQTTIENLPDEEFEVALAQQRYEVCNRWFTRDRIEEEGGTEISRRVALTDTGTAKMVNPFEKTAIGVVDVMSTVKAPWVHLQVHWTTSRQEMLRNRGRSKLISHLKARRVPAKLDAAKLLENQAWGTPNNSNDEINARGLPYWLSLANDGVSAAGFTGQTIRFGDGTTSTTKGGIDSTAAKKERWQNWVGNYATFNHALIKAMRLAWIKMNFIGPTTVEETTKRPWTDFRIYMGQEDSVDYEELATSGNDNLGPDVAPYNGNSLVFKRTPIIPIPQLNDFSVTDGGGNDFSPKPIYFVNHAKFFPIVNEGEWMRENEPMNDVEQHNVFTVFVDSEFQFFCGNVQEGGGVIHKTIPAT